MKNETQVSCRTLCSFCKVNAIWGQGLLGGNVKSLPVMLASHVNAKSSLDCFVSDLAP